MLGLHAWGDSAGDWLHRKELAWTYPERTHGGVIVRLPRSHDADGFAAREVENARARILALHGAAFRLRPPAEPLHVHLLEKEAFASFGFSAGADGACDPARGIAVRIDPVFNQGAASRDLRHQTAHAILQASGRKGWSPWLEEGMAAILEATPVLPNAEVPSLPDLLQARPGDFRGPSGPRYTRGAALLATFLHRTMEEAFFHYYWEELERGPAGPGRFSEIVNDPSRVEVLWKEWLKERSARHE